MKKLNLDEVTNQHNTPANACKPFRRLFGNVGQNSYYNECLLTYDKYWCAIEVELENSTVEAGIDHTE